MKTTLKKLFISNFNRLIQKIKFTVSNIIFSLHNHIKFKFTSLKVISNLLEFSMKNLTVNLDCIKLLNLDLDCIFVAGYIEKQISQTEYLAKVYMRVLPKIKLTSEEIKRCFLAEMTVFFLKKTNNNFHYIEHEKYIRTQGKICEVLTCDIEDDIYIAKIVISNLNIKIVQDLSFHFFVGGNEDLEDFAGFLFID